MVSQIPGCHPLSTKAVLCSCFPAVSSLSWLELTIFLHRVDRKNRTITISFTLQAPGSESLVLRSAPTCPKEGSCAGLMYQDVETRHWFPVQGTSVVGEQTLVMSFAAGHRPSFLAYLFADWPLCTIFSTSSQPALPFLIRIY
jgi:hypothetical protein